MILPCCTSISYYPKGKKITRVNNVLYIENEINEIEMVCSFVNIRYNHIIFFVYIKNKSDSVININPENFYYVKDKIRRTEIKSVSIDEMISKINHMKVEAKNNYYDEIKSENDDYDFDMRLKSINEDWEVDYDEHRGNIKDIEDDYESEIEYLNDFKLECKRDMLEYNRLSPNLYVKGKILFPYTDSSNLFLNLPVEDANFIFRFKRREQ